MLYLDHLGLDKVEVVDSVKLDAEGLFSFTPVALRIVLISIVCV